LNDPRDSARAIDALRRGWPVVIDGALTVLAVESADAARLAAFDPEGRANILISAPRAATLKLTNQLAAANPGSPVVIARTSWLDLPAAMALADPATDLAHPLQGPYRAMPCAQPIISGAALDLARQAGLLPAFFVLDAAVIGCGDRQLASAGTAGHCRPRAFAGGGLRERRNRRFPHARTG
jgi:GTP cyclohydrolase II